MGYLQGHGVHFGVTTDLMAAGEGLETMPSLHCALPDLPTLAALSANHLTAILFPAALAASMSRATAIRQATERSQA